MSNASALLGSGAAATKPTYSPRTGRIVIERRGYHVIRNDLANGVTPEGEPIPGVWQ